MAALSELLGHLSDDAYVRGRQFERICKWYLLHDPAYRSQIKRVWLWDDWPGRWAPDAGIDLVAETNEGKLWAVQAKAYDPRYSGRHFAQDCVMKKFEELRLSFGGENEQVPAS